ncbi:MAG TPA: nucleotidyltransferase domain-containing protein [Myxococcota bacterium]|nr:nucleotidyltransferase domain-containing protein [Myxococcota bacterium]
MGLINTQPQLRPRDQAVLERIFKSHSKIEEVRIYGSRARGNAKRASDVDLAISAPGMTSAEWAGLALDLREAPIVYEIDLLREDKLPDGALKAKSRREGVRIYTAIKKPEQRD